jgi:SAM-dependent methyltransferase
MSNAWERFVGNMQGERQSFAAVWSDTYRIGDHHLWDQSAPSSELVGYILGARFPASARVLDLGCGTGADATFLATQDYEVHGLDFSADALRLASERARQSRVVVAWHECSALNTPFDAGYFDLITDRGCCHHIGEALRRRYAEEFAHILKPGGVLFLRGRREADDPFFPIDRKSLSKEDFDPQLFEVGADIPFFCASIAAASRDSGDDHAPRCGPEPEQGRGLSHSSEC